MAPKLRRLRLLPLLLPLLLIPLLAPLLSPFPARSPALPPSLSRLLPPRPHRPAPPPSWKQPAVVALHARAHNASHHLLSLFTAGVDTQSFSRVFTPAACVVARAHVFPLHAARAARAECLVPRAALADGAHVSLLLLHDRALRDAQAHPARLNGELFELLPGDVHPVEDEAKLTLHNPALRAHLREAGGPGLAHVRSHVRWDDAALDTPTGRRWELCLMTAMKQYPFLLPPWLEYYKRMGVDQVFVYDNGAAKDLRDVLRGWEGFAQAVWWPWPRSQMQSNNHFLLASANRCRYVAFFDADEFVMVGGQAGREGGLKRYVKLRNAQGYNQISFRFLVMVNSGFVRRPQGDLPELYVHRAAEQPMSSGKVVIERDREWIDHKIHIVKGKGQKMYWNMTLELDPNTVEHSAMVVHYTHRSWEDFVAKNEVGGASVMTTGRPPKKLDKDKPDPEYMNEKKVRFDGFRSRWRETMKIKNTGRVMLTWRRNGAWCTARYCASCWRRELEGTICETGELTR